MKNKAERIASLINTVVVWSKIASSATDKALEERELQKRFDDPNEHVLAKLRQQIKLAQGCYLKAESDLRLLGIPVKA